jgi:RimJ/RimL family protein N-acetyltransferase
MLQDIPTPTLREARSCVLETERLMLRRPTLADVKAIARLANDRRIAENTRRLPHSICRTMPSSSCAPWRTNRVKPCS